MSLAETKSLTEFSEVEAEIAKIQSYADLIVASPDDKAGFEVARKAKRATVSLRTSFDKIKKKVKAPHWDKCKAIDAEAKQVVAMIKEIEDHVDSQIKIVTDEQLRLKRVEKEKRDAQVADWKEKLHAVGYLAGVDEVSALSKESFMSLLQVEMANHEARETEKAAEEKRQADLAEANRIEREKLDAEKAKQEAEAAAEREKLRVEREEMKAEQDRIRAEQADAQRKIDEANAAAKAEQDRLERIEFERNAKIQAEKDAAEKAKAEAKRKAEADEAERLRQAEADRQAELMKTDSQKIGDLIDNLMQVDWPTASDSNLPSSLKSDKANEIVEAAYAQFESIVAMLGGVQQ